MLNRKRVSIIVVSVWLAVVAFGAYRIFRPWYLDYRAEKALLGLASDDDPASQRLLAEHYYDEGDFESAFKWERSAAERGDAGAQNFLGLYFRYGINEHLKPDALDDARAREWFEKAAAQDFRYSQEELCEMYQRGLGISPDQATAYFWCSLSEPSDRTMKFKQFSIEALDPESRAAVDRRVAVWIDSHRKSP